MTLGVGQTWEWLIRMDVKGITAAEDGRLLALHVPRSFDALESYRPEAVDRAYVTDPELPLQIVVGDGAKGYLGQPHIHPPLASRAFPTRHKVVVCSSGSLRIHISDVDGQAYGHVDLGPGDMLLITEGHQVEILEEDTRFMEIKQGPYPGKREAEREIIEVLTS